jgi:hypothetical protein
LLCSAQLANARARAGTEQEGDRIIDLPLALILNQKVETKGRIEVRLCLHARSSQWRDH